jgi:hypothetical protein
MRTWQGVIPQSQGRPPTRSPPNAVPCGGFSVPLNWVSPEPPNGLGSYPRYRRRLGPFFLASSSTSGNFPFHSSFFLLSLLTDSLNPPTTTLCRPPSDQQQASTSMKETSPDKPYIDRIRFWASSEAHGGSRSSSRRREDGSPSLAVNKDSSRAANTHRDHPHQQSVKPGPAGGKHPHHQPHHPHNHGGLIANVSLRGGGGGSHHHNNGHPAPDPPGLHGGESSSPGGHTGRRSPAREASQAPGPGPVLDPGDGAADNDNNHHHHNSSSSSNEKEKKPAEPLGKRFLATCWRILTYSYLNLLLVFVPIGIAVEVVPGMSPGVKFAMNALAIVPLAGLLSYATESVAHKMGDSIGALLNVTFGNAVELIILYALSPSSRPLRFAS